VEQGFQLCILEGGLFSASAAEVRDVGPRKSLRG
jgi:hypothetical protein